MYCKVFLTIGAFMYTQILPNVYFNRGPSSSPSEVTNKRRRVQVLRDNGTFKTTKDKSIIKLMNKKELLYFIHKASFSGSKHLACEILVERLTSIRNDLGFSRGAMPLLERFECMFDLTMGLGWNIRRGECVNT